MANRRHLPSCGKPRSEPIPATYIGIAESELYNKRCLVGESGVPGYSMVQFDDRKLPVAWTHGWHMRPTAEFRMSPS